MNPRPTALPATPRAVNDVARPAPAAAPAPTAAAAAPSAPAANTNVVANIPVHVAQAAPVPAPANEDTELDQIMHDVGQELKKEDSKPQKHGLLDFLHKPKPLVKSPAPPKPQTAMASAPRMDISQAAPAAPAMPGSVAKPQASAPAKPKTQRSIPAFAIFVTICVTGFLVAAAIAAYRQS